MTHWLIKTVGALLLYGMVDPDDPLFKLVRARMPEVSLEEMAEAVENLRWLVDFCRRMAKRPEEEEE